MISNSLFLMKNGDVKFINLRNFVKFRETLYTFSKNNASVELEYMYPYLFETIKFNFNEKCCIKSLFISVIHNTRIFSR